MIGRILLAECGIFESGSSFLLSTFLTFLAFLWWTVLIQIPSIKESNVVSLLLKMLTKRETDDFFFNVKRMFRVDEAKTSTRIYLVNYFRLFGELLISQSVLKSCGGMKRGWKRKEEETSHA